METYLFDPEYFEVLGWYESQNTIFGPYRYCTGYWSIWGIPPILDSSFSTTKNFELGNSLWYQYFFPPCIQYTEWYTFRISFEISSYVKWSPYRKIASRSQVRSTTINIFFAWSSVSDDSRDGGVPELVISDTYVLLVVESGFPKSYSRRMNKNSEKK